MLDHICPWCLEWTAYQNEDNNVSCPECMVVCDMAIYDQTCDMIRLFKNSHGFIVEERRWVPSQTEVLKTQGKYNPGSQDFSHNTYRGLMYADGYFRYTSPWAMGAKPYTGKVSGVASKLRFDYDEEGTGMMIYDELGSTPNLDGMTEYIHSPTIKEKW